MFELHIQLSPDQRRHTGRPGEERQPMPEDVDVEPRRFCPSGTPGAKNTWFMQRHGEEDKTVECSSTLLIKLNVSVKCTVHILYQFQFYRKWLSLWFRLSLWDALHPGGRYFSPAHLSCFSITWCSFLASVGPDVVDIRFYSVSTSMACTGWWMNPEGPLGVCVRLCARVWRILGVWTVVPWLGDPLVSTVPLSPDWASSGTCAGKWATNLQLVPNCVSSILHWTCERLVPTGSQQNWIFAHFSLHRKRLFPSWTNISQWKCSYLCIFLLWTTTWNNIE